MQLQCVRPFFRANVGEFYINNQYVLCKLRNQRKSVTVGVNAQSKRTWLPHPIFKVVKTSKNGVTLVTKYYGHLLKQFFPTAVFEARFKKASKFQQKMFNWRFGANNF